MIDAFDDSRLRFTPLDEIRISDMEIGEKVEGEVGGWQVFRYKREYTLNLIEKCELRDFPTLEGLMTFLKRLSAND